MRGHGKGERSLEQMGTSPFCGFGRSILMHVVR
jgi:hypothetical protein